MDMRSRLAQQAYLQSASPQEQMIQMLENAKRNAAAEKTAPVLPMEYIDPRIISFQIGIQRERFDSDLNDKDKTLQLRQTFIGTAPKFSSTPLNKLKRVNLKDMKIRKRHEGMFLLCRTITPPTRIVGVPVGVEDPNGWAQPVAIYNFPGTFDASGKELDTLFPLHTILAIREPWAKMALSGNHAQIRVDSPSDIVVLSPENPILNGVTWANGKRTSRATTASSAEWKSTGDTHFKEKQYFAAAVAYTYALNKDPSSTAIRLNRCLSHIRLSNFSFAFQDSQILLQVPELQTVDKTKALYRAALAQYGSGRYEEAEGYYRECLSVDANLEDVVTGVEKCRLRIQEREKGSYDWIQLFRQGSMPSARPDVADYLGPVKVSNLEHRGGGRGIIATRDIKPGELLFVFKAFAVSFPKDLKQLGSLFAMNFLTNIVERGTHYDLLQRTVSKVAANDHISTPLLELYAGIDSPEVAVGSTSSTDPRATGDPMRFKTDIDIERIEAIISFNSFGIQEKHGPVELEGDSRTKEERQSDMASALYTYPSFINHSCIGNATRTAFGHVMVIRAVQDIQEGEEIMMSYCGYEVPYLERTGAISKYFKECDCSLCVSDRAAGRRFHEALGNLNEQMSQPVSLKKLRELVNKVDAMYTPSYPTYRPASFEAHHRLAYHAQKALINTTDTASRDRFAREAIQHEITALEALRFQVTDKSTKEVRSSDKKKIILPLSLNRVPYHSGTVCMTCWSIAACFATVGNQWRAEMWLRSAVWFEDMSLGGGIALFRLRYAKALEAFGPVLEAILDKIEKSA